MNTLQVTPSDLRESNLLEGLVKHRLGIESVSTVFFFLAGPISIIIIKAVLIKINLLIKVLILNISGLEASLLRNIADSGQKAEISINKDGEEEEEDGGGRLEPVDGVGEPYFYIPVVAGLVLVSKHVARIEEIIADQLLIRQHPVTKCEQEVG